MQILIWLMYINVCYVMPYLSTMLGTPYPRSTRRGQAVACTMLHSTELPSDCILWWINAVTKLLHPYPSDIRWCHMHASIIGDRRFVIRCTRQCVVAVNKCKLCSRVSPRYPARWRNPKHGKRLPPLSVCGQVQLCSEAHGFLIYPR